MLIQYDNISLYTEGMNGRFHSLFGWRTGLSPKFNSVHTASYKTTLETRLCLPVNVTCIALHRSHGSGEHVRDNIKTEAIYFLPFYSSHIFQPIDVMCKRLGF